MNRDTNNVGQFRGTISEVDDPLVQESGRVSGHSVEVQQMGVSLRMWVPASEVERPNVGDDVTVEYKLVPQSSGWPKVKTTRVKVNATAKPADAKGAA
ncbi:MAG: hypothetical protein AAF333_07460 [Planctomycetota bacterium]